MDAAAAATSPARLRRERRAASRSPTRIVVLVLACIGGFFVLGAYGLVAYLFLLLDDWDMAFAQLAFAGAVATGAVAVVLYRRATNPIPDRPRLRRRKPTVRRAWRYGAASLVLLVAGPARVVDFPPLDRRVPAEVRALGIEVEGSRWFRASSFMDSEWIWRGRVSRPEVERIAAYLGSSRWTPVASPPASRPNDRTGGARRSTSGPSASRTSTSTTP